MESLKIHTKNSVKPNTVAGTWHSLTTTETEISKRAREVRQHMLKARSERRQKHGWAFEKAVQEADGHIQLRGLLLANLAKKKNELCDLFDVDTARHKNKMAELERSKKETIEALKTLI